MKHVIVILLALVVVGCASTKPLKGGRGTTSQSAGRTIQTVVQGENTAQVSRQDQESVRTRS